MSPRLCLQCCRELVAEVGAAVAAEGWSDVAVYGCRCGESGGDALRKRIAEDCSQVVVLCCDGCDGLAVDGLPAVRRVQLRNRFQWLTGTVLVDDLLARHAFLVTPDWLNDWRAHLCEFGCDEANAVEFFHGRVRELVLLDTGIHPDTESKFTALSEFTGLPAIRLVVGLDWVRLRLSRVVAEWRLEEERGLRKERERDYARERADHLSAMDFLGRLALLKEEQEAIAAIEEMFHMLFAPQELHYVRFEGGVPQCGATLPADMASQFRSLATDWAWTESGTGFIMRIGRMGETLGAVAVDRFIFPQFRSHYLNLALSVAGVCGLAIENARTYLRIKEAEQALRMSEQRLKMAQSIAHLGHWEWDVNSGEINWSEETYRILGYEPHQITPSHDTFFQVIHPDDRMRVADKIGQVRAGSGFDLEYKIVLPDGRQRVVHGMGEVIFLANQQKFIGALQDVTAPERAEVLGVIQDITERKELEWRLEQEARTDALTGCANRRYFRELVEHEFARARRYGKELSMLMLDLDHFKLVNDVHGHQVGDATLQKLAQVCRTILRLTDVIGRLGGEEFAIVLGETGSTEALEVAERLRHALAAAEVPLDDKPPLRFTASIGIATLAPQDTDADAILARADQALYTAKGTGRNKVVAWKPASRA